MRFNEETNYWEYEEGDTVYVYGIPTNPGIVLSTREAFQKFPNGYIFKHSLVTVRWLKKKTAKINVYNEDGNHLGYKTVKGKEFEIEVNRLKSFDLLVENSKKKLNTHKGNLAALKEMT